ncbi:translation factor SUA5 [Hoeflea marina]|uniref:Threonylcarbamoyl-AMP synthase n=1 Tax=Hoeflea marina TaxID=274592 RepID=A0A317PLL3_9HYPH|nr:L-threonylcarbamoyladenylate synthase [Hoeflea marina]PWW01822.1 translation factor SUA5 [Hoeflea marina]
MAQILTIDSSTGRALGRAVEALARGEPIGLPTETVYGLAADATNAEAITRIYETKDRPRFNPLISHMSGLDMARRHAVFNPLAERLANAFWPGALTLVLPLAPDSDIHALATAGLPSVAVRVPTGFAADVIAAFGKPLAAPSANRSGRISPTTAQHVADDIGDRIGLILDAGPCAVGVESTIVEVTDSGLRLLRPGGVTAEAIEAETGLRLSRQHSDPGQPLVAPGMMASHYAPAAQVRLDAERVWPGEVALTFAARPMAGLEDARLVLDLSPAGDLREAAANLFDYLKRADSSGAEIIAVASIPGAGLGEAINDRLRRAAAPRPATHAR